MVSRRLAREEGHHRKFLCVIDDTPECDRAVVYAATRARHTAGGLVLLYVIPPGDFQHWRGVEEMMRAEAMDEARQRLAASMSQMLSPTTTLCSICTFNFAAAVRNRSGSGFAYLT